VYCGARLEPGERGLAQACSSSISSLSSPNKTRKRCFLFPDLESRKTELEGEVFEMLFTLTDFLAFKEMFVDYKVMKQAGALDSILSVTTI